MMRTYAYYLLSIPVALLSFISVEARELTERLSLNGVLSGAVQCQKLLDDSLENWRNYDAIPESEL